jgi:penicillin-binding protein 1A
MTDMSATSLDPPKPKRVSPWDRFLLGKVDRVVTPPDNEAPALAVPKPPSKRWIWIKRGFSLSLLAFILIIAWLAVTAPLSKSLEPIAPPRLTLLSADGQPIARNGAIIDRPVRIGLLPPHVKQAFIAIEDRRFYSHWGIDPRGIARAAWNNIGSGGTQGASTITQQLAKFTFLTADRTYSRKAREMFKCLFRGESVRAEGGLAALLFSPAREVDAGPSRNACGASSGPVSSCPDA